MRQRLRDELEVECGLDVLAHGGRMELRKVGAGYDGDAVHVRAVISCAAVLVLLALVVVIAASGRSGVIHVRGVSRDRGRILEVHDFIAQHARHRLHTGESGKEQHGCSEQSAHHPQFHEPDNPMAMSGGMPAQYRNAGRGFRRRSRREGCRTMECRRENVHQRGPKRMKRADTLAWVAVLVVVACDPPADDRTAPSASSVDQVGSAAVVVTNPGRSVERDREIFEQTMRRAQEEGVDTLPIGERIVAIGRCFVGADYIPGTLEIAPEQLVVNLEHFDCVTYVESVLALARVVDEPTPTFEGYLDQLRRIRYRQGELDGYASRLHYFSEWISDNAALGIVRNITRELGGIPLDEHIDFMSANRELYPALRSDDVVEQIGDVEASVTNLDSYYIPKDRIADVASQIRNGDIIAATSAIDGLDVAHTGFAIRIDGALHFMNAPLVGRSVEISELPLAARMQRIPEQDGIMIARPL